MFQGHPASRNLSLAAVIAVVAHLGLLVSALG